MTRSTPHTAFACEHLASHLSERIEAHFGAPERDIDPSLVIGIFGEWGAGKTTLLERIGRKLEARDDRAGRPLVCVRFNAWRYEREAHLIVPLLKVTEYRLRARTEDTKGLAEKAVSTLRQAARFTGIAALSFASAFKARVGLPGLGELDVASKATLDQVKALLDDQDNTDDTDSLATLSSHYFGFEQQLRRITRPSGEDPDSGEGIDLVFLIDDLDRCLPDKAVEMLESIKLFLDVEGCAFVIAVDDEVVERGIRYRYRDYAGHDGNGHPLITGAEYLEKIIHLPFRLPVPTAGEVRDFLRTSPRTRALFEMPATERRRDRNIPDTEAPDKTADAAETGPQWDERLLELFARALPPVPRKLIRAVEMLELQMQAARARGWTDFDRHHLARVMLLQLFAPELYRFARRHYVGLLALLHDWSQRAFPAQWQCEGLKEAVEQHARDNDRQALFERYYRPILERLEALRHDRHGFDLDVLLEDRSACETARPGAYFSLLDDTAPEAADDLGPDALPEAARLPEARLALLLSREAADWRSALDAPELQGRRLHPRDLDTVIERLKTRKDAPSPDWLEAMAVHLTAEQLQRLYRETGLIRSLIAQARETDRHDP